MIQSIINNCPWCIVHMDLWFGLGFIIEDEYNNMALECASWMIWGRWLKGVGGVLFVAHVEERGEGIKSYEIDTVL